MTKVKKTLAVAISAALIITSIPPREVEASWFSDLMGGLFTVITSPILLFAKDNPTLRKNNPFRKKVWEEEEEAAERERDKEIIKRLSSQPPERVVVERETVIKKKPKIIHSVDPTIFPEINALRHEVAAMRIIVDEKSKEVAELENNVAYKTTEISILQHIMSNIRNGKDGKDGKDGAAGRDGKDGECVALPPPILDYKIQQNFFIVDDGNTTRMIGDGFDFPQMKIDVPMGNERDLRTFKAIVAVAIAAWAIQKFFYVRPYICLGTMEYKDSTTRTNVFLKTSATIFASYCGYKYVNKKLSVNELWTDAKDLTMGVGSTLGWAGGGVVDFGNRTVRKIKPAGIWTADNVLRPVGNWTIENVLQPTGNFLYDNRWWLVDKTINTTIYAWKNKGEVINAAKWTANAIIEAPADFWILFAKILGCVGVIWIGALCWAAKVKRDVYIIEIGKELVGV